MQTATAELPSGGGKEGKCFRNSQMELLSQGQGAQNVHETEHGTVPQLQGSSDIGTSCPRSFRKAVLFNGHQSTHPL